MKFLKIDQKKTHDFVQTEDRIIELLKNDSRSKSLDYECAEFNWANYINNHGIAKTQEVIDDYCRKFNKPEEAIYICQHISVDKLNWRTKNIFTPHCYNQSYKPIPHLAVNKGEYTNFKDRKYDISFIGSFETHYTRKIASNSIKTNTIENKNYVKDTGNWHFYNRTIEREELYKSVLSETKISLCPRGTGPSTIRLWESIATGCIPLVITENKFMPLSNIINWDALLIHIKPEFASLTGNIANNLLKSTSIDKLTNVSKILHETFNQYFSKDTIHLSIIKNLEV